MDEKFFVFGKGKTMKNIILITGGCGFIGTNAADYYLKRGYKVIIFDNLSRAGGKANLNWLKTRGPFIFIKEDVRDDKKLLEVFKKYKPDLVLHLAAQTTMVNSIKNPREDFEINALGTFNLLIFFHFKVYKLHLDWQKSIWQRFLSMSWPLALAGIFGGIYTQTDSVVMGYLGQLTQTGWYQAAYKIIGVTLIPTGLISQSFFPALSLAFSQSKDYNPPTTSSHSPKGERAPRLQKIWNYFMDLMIILAIPIVVGGIVLGPRIIDFIYDPSYFPSILAFQILILMAGTSFLCSPFGQILVVANQQKKLLWITLSGAIVNVILNLILIPRYSLYGAAAATVATSVLILFLLFKFTTKLTPIRPFNLKSLFSFFGAILASIPMYFLIIQPQIYHLNIFFSISIGASIYLICFLGYKKLLVQFRILR